MSANANAGPLA